MASPGDGGKSTYGFPIYCAAWLPLAHIRKPDAPADADDASSSAPPPPRSEMVVLGGGGGEGRSGVPNKLAVAALEPDAAPPALSAEPVLVVETREEVPYRMAVHPRGDGVVCAFPNRCRLYKWELREENESHELGLNCEEEALAELKDGCIIQWRGFDTCNWW